MDNLGLFGNNIFEYISLMIVADHYKLNPCISEVKQMIFTPAIT